MLIGAASTSSCIVICFHCRLMGLALGPQLPLLDMESVNNSSLLSAGSFLGICTQALTPLRLPALQKDYQLESGAAQPPVELAIWHMLKCCSSPDSPEMLVCGFLSMPVQAPSLLLSQAFQQGAPVWDLRLTSLQPAPLQLIQLQGICAARAAHPVSGSMPNWRTCGMRKWQDCWQMTGHLASHTHKPSML